MKCYKMSHVLSAMAHAMNMKQLLEKSLCMQLKEWLHHVQTLHQEVVNRHGVAVYESIAKSVQIAAELADAPHDAHQSVVHKCVTDWSGANTLEALSGTPVCFATVEGSMPSVMQARQLPVNKLACHEYLHNRDGESLWFCQFIGIDVPHCLSSPRVLSVLDAACKPLTFGEAANAIEALTWRRAVEQELQEIIREVELDENGFGATARRPEHGTCQWSGACCVLSLQTWVYALPARTLHGPMEAGSTQISYKGTLAIRLEYRARNGVWIAAWQAHPSCIPQ